MKTIKPKNSEIRLNRLLAQHGIAARRKADELILRGCVSVNGKIVRELGTKVHLRRDEVAVNGEPISLHAQDRAYFLFHKPEKVVTTLSDPEGRTCIADFLPKNLPLFPVGRLDYDAEGVLLLTNDGSLSNFLTHPRYGVKKTYQVKVSGKPNELTIKRIQKGFRLDDGFVRPSSLRKLRETKQHSWFQITLKEGRNHIVKRIFDRVRHPVRRLIRTQFAGLTLEDLPKGKMRKLKRHEIASLYQLVEENISNPTL